MINNKFKVTLYQLSRCDANSVASAQLTNGTNNIHKLCHGMPSVMFIGWAVSDAFGPRKTFA